MTTKKKKLCKEKEDNKKKTFGGMTLSEIADAIRDQPISNPNEREYGCSCGDGGDGLDHIKIINEEKK